jgi:hypothetical protein
MGNKVIGKRVLRVGVALWRTRQSCGKRLGRKRVRGEEAIEREGFGEIERIGTLRHGKRGHRWKTP